MPKPSTRDRMPPFVPGSATSARAANAIRDVRHGVGAQILGHLLGATGGLTCDQIEKQLKMAHQTVSARLCELAGADCVFTNGNTRATSHGQQANVYVAKFGATVDRYQNYLKKKRLQSESWSKVRMQEKVVVQFAYDYGRKPSATGLENLGDAAKKLHQELQRHRGLV